jgi:hypothetical protein
MSGDFIAHANYRVAGNATAAVAAKNKTSLHDVP